MEETAAAWRAGRYAHIEWSRGDENPNWRGGKSEEAIRIRNSGEYRAWRRAVLFRDGYCCTECGAREEKGKVVLHAHHLEGFADAPDQRLDPVNGVTLCGSCHARLHKQRPILPSLYDKRGEGNPKAKLNWDQVRDIRARYAAGGIRQIDLAREYGVTQPNIGDIVRGNTWREFALEGQL